MVGFKCPMNFALKNYVQCINTRLLFLTFFVIEMNVAPLVVMIDSMIIVATPSLNIEWGNLMANIEEGLALMDKLRLHAFCVAKWQKVQTNKLMEEEITLSKSMWYLCCFLHESSSYLKLVKILRKQNKLWTRFLVVKFSIYQHICFANFSYSISQFVSRFVLGVKFFIS